MNVQVVNGSASSNIVQNYLGLTAPGVSTVPDPGLASSNTGGIGIAAMLHQDGITRVTVGQPGQAGRDALLHLTGLERSRQLAQGRQQQPSSPLSYTSNTTLVWIDDASGNFTSAKVLYAGLAGLWRGANQINFTIPT